MVEIGKFLSNSIGLYFGDELREDGYNFIHEQVLWREPFFIMMFFSLWYSILNKVEFGFFPILKSVILFSLASVLVISFIYMFMKILGGIGTFFDTFKFGLSIWFFPTLVNIFLSFVNILVGNAQFSVILGLIASLLGVWSIIISVLIYAKVHKLTIEMSVLGLIFPFVIMTIFMFFLYLMIN